MEIEYTPLPMGECKCGFYRPLTDGLCFVCRYLAKLAKEFFEGTDEDRKRIARAHIPKAILEHMERVEKEVAEENNTD